MTKRWQNNYLPALLWMGVSLFVPHWHMDSLGGLMVLRAILVLRCLLIRFVPSKKAPNYQIAVSWLSALLPMALYWSPEYGGPLGAGTFLVIVGTFLVGLACIDLGNSFGVSPALRPFVQMGVYRHIRNPMYLGHVITEMGMLLASPSAHNLCVIALCWTLYLIRSHWESELFQLNSTHQSVLKNLKPTN